MRRTILLISFAFLIGFAALFAVLPAQAVEKNDSQPNKTSRVSAGFVLDDGPSPYVNYVPMLFKQMWGTYDSALYMENISDTNIAHITVKFYDVDGVLICTKSDTIPAMGVVNYWLPKESCLPNQWYGGVVITSDQPVISVGRPHIGNEVVTYNGFTAGSTTQYVPMLFKQMWGSYDSALYIQNTDTTNQATVTIKFYDPDGVLNCTKADTIPAMSSHGYWLPTEACLPANWYGGVVITSDLNIVAVGRPHIGNQVMTYNGFSSGSLSMYVPMLFKQMWGYDSAFYVQNTDPSNAATVSIKFYDPNGVLNCTKPDTIPAMSSHGYWLPSETCLPANWYGGVVVTSDRAIVAVGRPHIGSEITTYNGFPGGGMTLYAPMLFKQYNGTYDSALYIQNVHASNTANITIKFYDQSGALSFSQPDTISPGSSKGYWLPSISGLPPSWEGSVKVESDQPVVGIVRPHLGGSITAYDGFAIIDTIPPAAISDLVATTGSIDGAVDLSWTAPGNDDNTGTASSYQVRYSTSIIQNEADWSNATAVIAGIPAPQAAGSSEQMMVTGLTEGATYYFAVRAEDLVPNIGGLSNSPSAVAKLDVTSPAVITDLSVQAGVADGSVDLTWTAPGDDGMTGTAANYLVRYRTTAITDQTSWDSATVVSSGVPTPQVAGSAEHMVVSGLTIGTTYYLSVRAQDEFPNLGGLSNSPSIPIVQHPAAITDLTAISGIQIGDVVLSWTAVGAYGNTGTASSYLVRYSTSAIADETTWNSATPVLSGIPIPQVAGSSESMTVSGLTQGTMYYFAIRALNDVSELGGLSNSPSTQPKSAPVTFCGTISADTTWGPWSSPYMVTCDVTIASGKTLTVLPGTVVKFNSGQGITITTTGTLNAVGTAGSPILFTANGSATPGFWKGISFGSSSLNSRLEYVTVEYGGSYGGSGTGNISTVGAIIQVKNSTIQYSSYYGLYASSLTNITLSNNTFTNNKGYAAYLGLSDGTITFPSGNTGSGNGKNGIALWGSIGADTTLSVNDGFPYIINGQLNVNFGKTLTLSPSAVVKFDGTSSSIFVNGTLASNGNSESPIYYTSIKDDAVGGDTNNDGIATFPTKGDWQWLYINSTGSAAFDHSTVRYGSANTSLAGNIVLNADATVNFSNGNVSDSGNGFYHDHMNGGIGHLTISNSIIEKNTWAGIISNYPTFILSVTNSTIRQNKYGIYGISYNNPTITGNTISDNTSDGILITNVNNITLSDNTFTNNTGYAANLRFSFSNGTFTSLGGNSGSGNSKNGIAIGGTFGANTTLPANLDFPYIIPSGSLSVNAGTTLTILQGSVLKFETGTAINVQGSLQAPGSLSQPIYFTSLKDDTVGGDTNNDGIATSPDKGDWGRISISSTGSAAFDHSTVRYGGASGFLGNIYLQSNATITFSSGTVSDSSNGFYAYEFNSDDIGHLIISNSIIENNATGISSIYAGTLILSVTNSIIRQNNYGIALSSHNSSTITGNNIYSNTTYGVYGSGASLINAQNNWWGDPNGPKPYGNGNGINYRTYTCGVPAHTCYDYTYYVNANPWLGITANNGHSVGWNAYVAEPVNTATGNYTYEHTDLSIPTRSLPLTFSHSYNSAAPENGSLGYGWTYTYNVFVTESSLDNSATITYGDGRTVRFDWNGTAYVPPAGTFSTLVKLAGLYTLTEKDQTIYAFNSSNKLSRITDKNGNVTNLNYTGTRLDSVTAPDGRQVSLSWDGSNRISSVTDPASRTISFGYNGSGNLTSFTDLTGKVTTYAYDANHRLLSITDANGHTFVINTYNSDGRVSQQQDASGNLTTFGYDIVTHITTVTDPRGKVTTYTYDPSLRLLNVKDTLGNTEYYTWDGTNNRTSFKDKRGNTTNYTYDSRGNLLTSTNPLSGVTSYTYDANNNLLSETDALTHATSYTYDSSNNLITKTNALSGIASYTYYTDTNRKGLMSSTTDPRLNTTSFDYDLYGNLDTITDALSHTTTRTYDLGGRMLTESDPLGHTTTYTYDNANRVVTTTDPAGGVSTNTYDDVGNLLTTTDPLGHKKTYTYTIKDQVATITDAEGYVTIYGYDSVGNRTSVMDGNGHTTTFAYDGENRITGTTNPLGKTTTFGYDANGNRTTVTDPLSHTTTYTYDTLNRQTVVTDPLTHATTTTYDLVGNVLSVKDANNHTITYAYDGLYHLLTVTDALSGVVTYTYDAAGNRLTKMDANSHTTTYTYDELNRLLTESDPLSHTWTYAYDSAGRRTSRQDANGVTTTYTYDNADRLTGISAPSISITYAYDLAGNRTSMMDASGTTAYTYDLINRPTSIGQPNGAIGYGYDAVNRTSVTLPGSRTTTYVYDAADQLTNVTDWNTQVTTYAYDNAGRQVSTNYPNGVVSTNTYDNADRLTGISTVKSATSILVITYTLDNVGNRLTMVEPSGTTTYTYDELNRLKSVAYPVGSPASVSYTYDPMGNRLTMTQDGVITTYVYDAADRLILTTGGSALSFTWDNDGQMLSKGSQTFSWDSLGYMSGLTNGGTTASYSYNGDGVRIGKSVNSTSISYLQNLASGLPAVLSEMTGGNTLRYVYGSDLISQVDGTTPNYYHADGLGSTRALTNAAGTSTDQYVYDAFGAERSRTGSSSNSFTYAGEQVDPEDGLTFLRARYYDPQVGRFITKDKWSGTVVNPQSYNKYVYVNNNPIKDIDPTGLFSSGHLVLGVSNIVSGVGQASTAFTTIGAGAAACTTVIGCIGGGALILYGANEEFVAGQKIYVGFIQAAIQAPNDSGDTLPNNVDFYDPMEKLIVHDAKFLGFSQETAEGIGKIGKGSLDLAYGIKDWRSDRELPLMERARKITIDLIGNISDMWEFINPPNVGGSVLGIRPESGYGAWYGPTSQGK